MLPAWVSHNTPEGKKTQGGLGASMFDVILQVLCVCVCPTFGIKPSWHWYTGPKQREYSCSLVSLLLIFALKCVPSPGSVVEGLWGPELGAMGYICAHEGEKTLIWECGKELLLDGVESRSTSQKREL